MLSKICENLINPTVIIAFLTVFMGPKIAGEITQKIELEKVRANMATTVLQTINGTNYKDITDLKKAEAIAEFVMENTDIFGLKFEKGKSVLKNLSSEYEKFGITNLPGNISTLQKSKEDKEKELSSKSKELVDAKKHLQNLSNRIDKLSVSNKNEKEDLEKQKEVAEKNIQALNTQINTITTKRSELEKQLSEQVSKYAEGLKILEAEKEKSKKYETQLKDVEKLLNDKDADTAVLKRQLEDLKVSAERMQKDKEEQANKFTIERNNLISRVSCLERKLTSEKETAYLEECKELNVVSQAESTVGR